MARAVSCALLFYSRHGCLPNASTSRPIIGCYSQRVGTLEPGSLALSGPRSPTSRIVRIKRTLQNARHLRAMNLLVCLRFHPRHS